MLKSLNFSLTQLEYALALQRHGHFGKAATDCGITQPTLSMQIQKLEEELNVVLFDRSKKPILLTDDGEKIMPQFQQIIFEARKMETLIGKNSKTGIEGTLNLGIIPTIAPDLLPRLLTTLREEHPKLHLDIKELQTHRIIEALENDQIDVGLLATPLNLSRIHEFPLYYEPFFVLCREDHELAKLKKIKGTQIQSDDIWLLEEGHCLRTQILDVCSLKSKAKEKMSFHFESGSIETLRNLVESFGGYTLIPQLSSLRTAKTTKLIPFERPIPAREIGLVFQRTHYKNHLIEALGESIINSLPPELKKLRKKDLEVLPV